MVIFSQVFVCPWRGGGLCPGSLCPDGGSLSRRGVSVQRVSMSRGCLCPGGSMSRGLSPGGLNLGGLCPDGFSVRETPPYGKEWAVRILLECILVRRLFCRF